MQTAKFLVQKIEYKFKFDFKYLLRHGLPMATGEVVTGIFTLILSMAFAHYFPQEVYGEYKFIMSIVEILAIFSLPAMTTGLATSMANSLFGSYKKVIKVQMLSSLLGTFFSILISIYYFYSHNNIIAIAFIISAFLLPFYDSLQSYTALLQGKKLFTELTISQALTQFVILIFLLISIYFKLNSASLVLAFLGANVLVNIFYTWKTKNLLTNVEEDPNVISFGLKQSFVGVIGLIANQIDKIFVFHFLGAAELAVYSFAIALPEQLKGVFKIIPVLTLPKFAATSTENLKKTLWRKTILFLVFTFFIVLAYIIAAPYIYEFFFPIYVDSVFYSRLFSISLLTLVGTIPTTIFQAKLDSKSLSKIYNITSTAQIIFMLIGVYYFGLIGIIVGRIIHRTFFALYSYYLVFKIQN